jgi:hypothetical protein
MACLSRGASAGGVRKRKVQRTTFNEKGEEVTEFVYEDDPTDATAGLQVSQNTRSFTFCDRMALECAVVGVINKRLLLVASASSCWMS